MKIALVGSTLFGRGAEFVLAALARGLSRRGHRVDVIVTKYHTDFAHAHPKMKPFDIGEGARLLITRARRGRYAFLELRRLFVRGGYDVVICQAAAMAVPCVVASLGLRHKLVCVRHSGCVGVDGHGMSVKPSRRFSEQIIDRLMCRLDAQFAVSRGTALDVHRMSGYPLEKIHVVNNPVFEEWHEIEKRKSAIPIVMSAGALCELKHYDLLIRAFSIVRKNRPCVLKIFGEGDKRNELEELAHSLGIDDSVVFPGFTNELKSELACASCFAISSYVESFCIVLVEALAAGVPVVSVDCPYGPREILQDGRNGLLVENNDAVALARGIECVLDGKGIQPTREMVAPYSFDAVAEQYEKELLKL